LLAGTDKDLDVALDDGEALPLTGRRRDGDPDGSRRFSIAIGPGDHILEFKQAMSLHDVWLEHR